MSNQEGDFAFLLGDFAHLHAERVYGLSEKCLMAHSIRATQQLLEDSGVGRHWISITISKSQQYMGKRAISFIAPSETDILVDRTIGLENQRRAIAHELAHLVLRKLASRTIHPPPGYTNKQRAIEDACNIFEKELCARHHKFHTDEQNKTKVLFPSLSDHSLAK